MRTILLAVCIALSGCSSVPYHAPGPAGIGMELWGWVNGEGGGTCLRYSDGSECCGYVVRTVCRDTGASIAGIRPGDVVYEIDGHALRDEPMRTVAAWARGEDGSTARVKLCGQSKTYNVIRGGYMPCW